MKGKDCIKQMIKRRYKVEPNYNSKIVEIEVKERPKNNNQMIKRRMFYKKYKQMRIHSNQKRRRRKISNQLMREIRKMKDKLENLRIINRMKLEMKRMKTWNS